MLFTKAQMVTSSKVTSRNCCCLVGTLKQLYCKVNQIFALNFFLKLLSVRKKIQLKKQGLFFRITRAGSLAISNPATLSLYHPSASFAGILLHLFLRYSVKCISYIYSLIQFGRGYFCLNHWLENSVNNNHQLEHSYVQLQPFQLLATQW